MSGGYEVAAVLSLVLLYTLVAGAAADAGTSLDPPVMFTPRLEDPLLAPLPRADREVKSWSEAVALLRERSTDGRRAEAQVQQAEGRSRQALAALLPNARLSAVLAYDLLHPDTPPLQGAAAMARVEGSPAPTVPLGTATVTLTQAVVDVSALQGVRAARAAEKSASSSLLEARRRLLQGLARTLVAAGTAERLADLNRLGLRQALARSELTARTRQLGAATELDVVRVQQDLEVARSALLAGDEQARRGRESLGLALGFDEAVGLDPSFPLQALVDRTHERCRPLSSPLERPDVVAAGEDVRSARASREQAAAGYLPSLGVSSSLFGYTTEPPPGRFASWTVSALLSVPLWEGGLRGGLVHEREGREEQAKADEEATRRRVSIEVAQARRGVEVARSLLEAAAAARTQAARTAELTLRSFQEGRGSSLELVQSGVVLRQADVTLVTREFEWTQAQLDAFLTEATCDW